MKLPSICPLDTNIVIAYFNGNRTIANKLKFHLPQVSISTLVFGELLYGARASQRREPNLEKVYQLSRIVNIVDFNQARAEQDSPIRVSLRQTGRPTGETDALIAAVALAYDAILVTDNLKHFQHIEGLVLENWLPEAK